MIAYTVTCRIETEEKAEKWLEWLYDGHISDVMDGGATGAEIVRRDNDGEDGITFDIHYRFESRQTMDNYLKNHAPRLREEGLTLFPPENGYHYSRTIGEILKPH